MIFSNASHLPGYGAARSAAVSTTLRKLATLLATTSLLLIVPDVCAKEVVFLPAQAPLITIATAEFCQPRGMTDVPPIGGCTWQQVHLAHSWENHGEEVADVWYKLHFKLSALPPLGLGMYTVALNRAGRVFVNGQMVRDIGIGANRLPMNWNRSQYITIPRDVLQVGSNEIEIQERDYWWEQGWLAPVQIGDETTLRQIWERRVFWQNESVEILAASTCAVGLLMLCVWLYRRQEPMYLWFGCVSLLWTLVSLDYFVEFPPLPPRLWEQFVRAAPVLRGALMFMFVLRYCGMRRRLLEIGIWTYFFAGACLILVEAMNGALAEVWYLGALVGSLYFFYLQVGVGLSRNHSEGLMLGAAGVVQITLSGYDIWLFSQSQWTDRVYLAHFSAPLYILVVAAILCRRVTESLTGQERLAGVLEARVADKSAELKRNHEQIADAHRALALASERTRIMREMHDGIGSQLTMALSLVQRLDRDANLEQPQNDGQVATVLKEGLEDLQLIIDSLEPVENDLLTVLGTLRYRLERRLGLAGVTLYWKVVDLPPLPMLNPQSALSILRIVQDAFANCIKHACATCITVTTGMGERSGQWETAQIRIVDNGLGMRERLAGRELTNMHRRAGEIGGAITINSQPGRTEVLLEFPTQRQLGESRSSN